MICIGSYSVLYDGILDKLILVRGISISTVRAFSASCAMFSALLLLTVPLIVRLLHLMWGLLPVRIALVLTASTGLGVGP